MRFENMVLYYKPTCPYCAKVLNFMDANDIEMDMKNTLEADNAETLIEISGTRQVPCLVVEGRPMLESDDIIAYLKQLS